MKTIFTTLFVIPCIHLFSQNVGVGTASPGEKLDVNGNINVTGTIKANGVDGTSGQVLMKNSSNILSWGNICDFKNKMTFMDTTLPSYNWVVPAGVTRIWVELWGAGGAGLSTGGGGGAYVSFFKNVSAGNSFDIEVGKAGKDNPSGGTTNFAQAGSSSRISSSTPAINVFAFGGTGAYISSIFSYEEHIPGSGGHTPLSALSGITEFYFQSGQDGSPLETKFYSLPSGQFNTQYIYGKGGDAGYTSNTGSPGGTRLLNSSLGTINVSQSRPGNFPGGGGGGMQPEGLINSSRAGANGLVIIHY